MNPQTFRLVVILSVSLNSIALAQPKASFTATEAAKHIGDTATVTDRVDGVHQSAKGNAFLNMGGKYPHQAFTAFIPAANAGQFSDIRQYEGKVIAVSGKIALYRGKPEIVVTSKTQVQEK